MAQKGKPIEIFISYAMADSQQLHIPEIAEELAKKSTKFKVHYWEGWDGCPNGDIIDYMEINITNSDIFIQIFTEASKKSNNCEKERKLAIFQNKKLIPIFENFNHVAPMFQPIKGVNILDKDTPQIVDELFQLIKSLMQIKIVEYQGIELYSTEADILIELEKQIGRSIPKVFKINRENEFFGFTAQDNHVTGLGLSKTRIDPVAGILLVQLTNLTNLVLGRNQIAEIPEYIGKLINLKELDLFTNELADVPESFEKLVNLEELHLGKNRFAEVPESIFNMKNLRVLFLDNNKLTKLPETLGNLTTLRELRLQVNNIEFLPKSLGNLRNLEVLQVYDNQLTSLPDSLIQLRNLEKLHIGRNFFKDIPDSIKDLKNLQELRLDNTPIAQSWEKRKRVERLVPLNCRVIWKSPKKQIKRYN